MNGLPESLENLIQCFERLPGIGKKTAQRLGFHIIKAEGELIQEFSESLLKVKENIQFCSRCHNFSEADVCVICANSRRDPNTICIVEEPSDIFLLEKTGFQGLYHVLGGVISPLDGVGPDQLHFDGFIDRVKDVEEVIVATNSTLEGDATALYISKLLSVLDVKVTRLARGVPVGGNLEYVDDATLSRSLKERIDLH
jgi:recombination protein RecR